MEEKYLTEENAEKYGVDIAPREIVINEYAAQAECASPGDLVRWIGLFEEYNVAGCLPFWHLSNNLNGLAAGNNEGNGAWWLYKWYGDMSGQYLPVATSNTSKDNYYGAASLDENKKIYAIAHQLLRSGTAIGALIKESAHAQSKADFLNKMNVALKEANETTYWLSLLHDTDYLKDHEFASINKDCEELLKLLISIVKTTKSSLNK